MSKVLKHWIERSTRGNVALSSIHTTGPNCVDPTALPKFYLKMYCKVCDTTVVHIAEGGQEIINQILSELLLAHAHDTNELEMWETLYGQKL